MPTAVDDGHGALIVLGTHTWDTAALILSITPDAVTRESLDTSHLATSAARTFMPADLQDNGGFTMEFLHIDAIAPPFAVAETVTITYPLGTGQSTKATIAGSAFCTEYTPGNCASGEIMKSTIKYKWTGALTYTAAT